MLRYLESLRITDWLILGNIEHISKHISVVENSLRFVAFAFCLKNFILIINYTEILVRIQKLGLKRIKRENKMTSGT